jgi:hypothetical protein
MIKMTKEIAREFNIELGKAYNNCSNLVQCAEDFENSDFAITKWIKVEDVVRMLKEDGGVSMNKINSLTFAEKQKEQNRNLNQ